MEALPIILIVSIIVLSLNELMRSSTPPPPQIIYVPVEQRHSSRTTGCLPVLVAILVLLVLGLS